MIVRPSSARVFVGYLVGVLLVQAAWILAVPAFRGSDEFDHVFKAAAVARFQWTAPEPAPHGRGGIVTIPGDLVRAASPVCARYKYTGHDNCFAIASVGTGGDVTVATAAGAYNPAYYLVVGTIARPFHGDTADFVMRAVTALICALMIAWAAAVTARWATTWWPMLTLTLGLTPVLLYSTAIAAPNGITFASSALVWSAVAALCRSDNGGAGAIAPLCVGSVALVATHTSGPMWLAFIGLVGFVLVSPRSLFEILRRRWVAWSIATVIVMVATALSCAWILIVKPNSLAGAPEVQGSFPFGQLPVIQLLWTLQAIAAFPVRNEPAPIPVYVLWGLLFTVMIVLLFRRARPRERIAALLALGLLALVPTVLTLISFQTQGVDWQGRYSLPLWLGVTAIAGLVLDRAAKDPRPAIICAVLALAGTALAMSAVHVGRHEVAHGATDPAAAGFVGGFVLVALLAFAGPLLPLLSMWRPRDRATTPPVETTTQVRVPS